MEASGNVQSQTSPPLTETVDRWSDFYRYKAWESRRNQDTERILTIPTILTLLRLFLVPIFMYLWLDQRKYSPFLSAVTFSVASATDWLDGYLARQVIRKPWCFSYLFFFFPFPQSLYQRVFFSWETRTVSEQLRSEPYGFDTNTKIQERS
mmetsp:Transcript_2103/g.4977  ORF Transcript_2103/g.4977 Transcript_2103/m.4977 type:complete len:151 (+) Transcript_2103:169-621(+)